MKKQILFFVKKTRAMIVIVLSLLMVDKGYSQLSNCLAFDGVDDYVNLGVMDANSGFSSGFTFEAWVKWNAFVGGSRLIELGDAGNQNNIIIRTQNTSGWIRTEIYNNGANNSNDMAEALNIGKWYHIAVTVGSGNVKIYLDGVQKVSASTNNINNSNRINCFLGKSNWADPYFPGLMDEVRIWKEVRTPDQIVSDMYNPVYINEPNLFRYFRFNQGVAGSTNTSITQLQDLSINNKPGTLANFALNGATSNWVVGYSYPMVLKVNTALGDASNTVTLPLNGTVNATVDWGDAGTNNYITAENVNHTYTTGGQYLIKITGNLSQFGNDLGYANSHKITQALSFGEIGLTSLGAAFQGDTNISYVPSYLPSTVNDLHRIFCNSRFNGNGVVKWNTTNVTNMHYAFCDNPVFNQNISGWNTVNVTDMFRMFQNDAAFNQNIGNWNVSNCLSINSMFCGATSFNQDLSNWNVSNATSIDYFICGSAFLPEYYTKMLINWSKLPVKSSVPFKVGSSQYYDAAQAAKNFLIGTKAWAITDGGSIATPLNFGLKAYYPFNGNANDESGNANNGTVNAATLTSDRFLSNEKAYSFNGVNQSINTGVGSGLTNTISLCAWFKTSTPKNFDPILVLRNGAYDVVGLYASTWGADGVVSFDFSDGSFKNVYASDKNYCDGNWHFAVGTYDGTTAKIYVDGELKQSSATASAIHFSSTFMVGFDNSTYYEGQIDDIRIYNRTLTDSDVLQLYQSAPGVSTGVVSSITSSSAICAGNVFFNGGTSVTSKGVCWSNSPNPTIAVNDGFTNEGAGDGIFSSVLTGLLDNTTYYVRAYATNAVGTNYGEEITFRTALLPPGNALSFDGINDFVRLPYTTEMCLAQSNFTIEAWVNIADNSYRQTIVHNANGCHSWQGWELSIGSQDGVSSVGKAVFSFNYNNAATYYEVAQTEPIATNRWVHLAGTYDGSNLRLFVDGVLNNTAPASGIPWTSDNPVSIGQDPGCGGRYALGGKIDELRIWNNTRSAIDIQNNFSNPLNGNETGLLAYFNFDQGIASGFNAGEDTLYDITNNNYDGTFYNFRLYSDTSNWVESYAMVIPSNLSASEITPYGFKVNWDAPAHGVAENYTLQVSQASNFSNILQSHNNIVDNSFSVSGLNPSSPFYFRLNANKPSINAVGAFSNYASAFTITDAICSAGADSTLCSKTYTMQAANPNPYTGLWTCINNAEVSIANASLYNTMVSNLQYGENIFVWEVEGLRDTVIIHCTIPNDINEQGIGANNLNDLVCSGGFSEINIINTQVGVSYQLLKDGVAYLSPQNGNGNIVSFLLNNITSSNTYTITAKDIASDCQINMSFSADILVIQAPVINLGSDLTVCKGANINLLAANNISYNYNWSNLANTAGIQINNILSDTAFSVTATNICGSYSDTINVNIATASNADFSTIPISANNFSFTNLVASTTNLWNFGDGIFSNETNPLHTFATEGFYNVCLSVADTFSGCNSSKCYVIEAGSNVSSCLASYTYTVGSVNEIAFNSSLSLGNLTNYYWQFGDGSVSFQANPIKVYSYSGLFNVKLTVYDTIGGCMNTYEEMITIGDASNDCEANFNYYTQSPHKWVYLTATDGLGNNYSYIWNFGDGNTSTEMNTVHHYIDKGYYDICLTVYNNNNGCSNMTCKNVLIGDSTIFCHAEFSYIVDTTKSKANSYPVSYKGAAFGDPAKGWDRKWEFGDGQSDSIKQNITHEFNQPGYYLTTFRIKNGSNSCTSTYYDLINVLASDSLRGSFGYEIDSNNTKANSYPVTYKGAAFGDPARLSWTFGDGTNDSTTINPTHIYNNPGTYNVCLTVSNPNINQSHTSCRDVEVYDYTKTNDMDKVVKASNVIINPNPGNGNFSIAISVPSMQNVEISVYDLNGKKINNIINQAMQKGNYNIYYQQSNEHKGIFYLKVVSGNEIKMIKFINL